MIEPLKAPFPWFGGKSKVADLVWERFGDVQNYVEPFFGSGAVLLGRPTEPGIETVNDLDCVAPGTRIWKCDLTWCEAGSVAVGDRLMSFDEFNGMSRIGLRAPQHYRRWKVAIVTHVQRIMKPCYRLTFDDGTVVVSSADHQWLGGSHVSGSRGWRWQKTGSLRCDKGSQRSWICKLTDVVEPELTYEAGWIAGFFDGEGNLKTTPGWQVNVTQKLGSEADRIGNLLYERNFKTTRKDIDRHNPNHNPVSHIAVTGGMREVLRFLMQIRPERLIRNLIKSLPERSLYGREKQAVGLVGKEFLGDREVIAIETDSHTFIAEGLASHNCMVSNFWRSLQNDPDAVADAADWPVNEADQHARHLWLTSQEQFRENMKTDPEFYDAKIAGWWLWGQCLWIGSGWCSVQRPHLGDAGMGIHRKRPHLGNAGMGVNRQLPHLGDAGRGVNRQLPHLGNAGMGVNRQMEFIEEGERSSQTREMLFRYMNDLANRLRRVRVCCGDWSRVCGPTPTVKLGITGVFLDPPYADTADRTDGLYSSDSLTVAHDVREWAIEQGDDQRIRIAFCGYEGEHIMPDSWECVEWKARGGYGSQGENQARENSTKERIWFSPHCLGRKQLGLFSTGVF
jgi:hypothetical protein